MCKDFLFEDFGVMLGLSNLLLLSTPKEDSLTFCLSRLCVKVGMIRNLEIEL